MNSTPVPGFLEWLKILFVFPTLGLVRIVLIAVVLLLVGLWCMLFTIGAPTNRPLPQWRSLPVRVVVGAAARMLLFVLGFYWITVTGKKVSSKVSERDGSWRKEAMGGCGCV